MLFLKMVKDKNKCLDISIYTSIALQPPGAKNVDENWEIKSLTISNETRPGQDKNWDKTALNCNTMPQKAPCPLYLGYAADFKSPAFITAQSHFSAQCLKIISKHQLWTILCLIVRDMIAPGLGEQYEELATYSIRGRQEVVCIIYDIPGLRPRPVAHITA